MWFTVSIILDYMDRMELSSESLGYIRRIQGSTDCMVGKVFSGVCICEPCIIGKLVPLV